MSKIVMTEQSSAPDTPGSGKVAIYVDTDGSLCWRKDDGVIVKIASAGSYTLTIPATGTAALRNVANTFTQAQTFSNAITAPGIKPAGDSTTAIQLQNTSGTPILTVDTTNNRVLINNQRLVPQLGALSHNNIENNATSALFTAAVRHQYLVAIRTSSSHSLFWVAAATSSIAATTRLAGVTTIDCVSTGMTVSLQNLTGGTASFVSNVQELILS